MFNKWVVSITLSLALLSGGAIGAENNTLVSYTDTIIHKNSSGGKGTDVIELTAPETAKNHCAFFDSVAIDYKIRRYADAWIKSQPTESCDPREEDGCKSIVSWEQSPAGRLNYKLKVGWVLKSC